MIASGLRRSLGLFETAGLSIAIMAPTAAVSLNAALASASAGPAVPLAFVIASVMIACVAFAFVTFAQTYATPASVGEFNARGLGPFPGRLSMWALLFVYALFTIGSAAEFGSFTASAFAYAGISVPWIAPTIVGLVFMGYLGTRPARTSSRAMLAIEAVSVLAIVTLSFVILARRGSGGLPLRPFVPDGAHLPGLGLATVFALLSFAGFEGAAVLGAESLAPKRTIPRALIVSVAASAALYMFVAYAQTIGFGLDARGLQAFATSASPMGALALTYANANAAIAVTAGAAISAFAATLASAVAAARLMFAFALEGRLLPTFGRVEASSGTPALAFAVVLGVCVLATSCFALTLESGSDTFAACGQVGVLALIIVYAAVQIAALRLFWSDWNALQRTIPAIAFVTLVATFVASLYPFTLDWAASYPVIVAVWLAVGAAILWKTAPAGEAEPE